MIISIIVAVADNDVIGRDGTLPWRISSDLKTFRRLTMGKPLIMGAAHVSVVEEAARRPRQHHRDARRRLSPARRPSSPATSQQRLKLRASARRSAASTRSWSSAAATLFEDALPIADRIYKTEVHGSPAGDAFFPTVDWANGGKFRARRCRAGANDDCSARLRRARSPPRLKIARYVTCRSA